MDKAKDDIKEKRLSADEGVCHRTSTQHKRGSKMKEKEKNMNI